MVWCDVPHLHAVGLVATPTWFAADDHARCSTSLGHHDTYFLGRGSLCGHEFDIVNGSIFYTFDRHVAARLDWLVN